MALNAWQRCTPLGSFWNSFLRAPTPLGFIGPWLPHPRLVPVSWAQSPGVDWHSWEQQVTETTTSRS
eukprot:471359-Alexandrium_andersonii.AAC.1